MACNDSQEKQALIEQEIKNAVEAFRQKKLRECYVAAYDSANKLADSIILVRNAVTDTSLFTGKPTRPTKPIIKSPLDTTPVEPLFKK